MSYAIPCRLRSYCTRCVCGSCTLCANHFLLPPWRGPLTCLANRLTHLRELETEGFVTLIEERRRGNCMERVVQATARSFVVSPEALGDADPMPEDRFSAAYLVAAAARVIREVAQIAFSARQEGKKMATYTLEGEVRFRTAEERSAFAAEMTSAFAAIYSKYDSKSASDARAFRFVVAGYRAITKPMPSSDRTAAILD